MQALILAAGMGRRLGELTQNNTKCMVKVHGVSLIERMLTQLSTISLERVIIVVGYEGKKVRELVGDNFKGLPVIYVENPIYDTTNNIYSLYLAKEYLLESDTILLESDLIISSEILKDLLNNPYPSLAVVSKYQSWMDGTVLTIDNDCNITGFIPKRDFNSSYIDKYYKTVNIYKFSKSFSKTHYVPFLQAYINALGNNEYYEQVLRVITLLEKPEIKAIKTTHKWYEIDDLPDLGNSEVLFAPDEMKYDLVQNRFGGYWRYPDLLDYCYLVNPYFPSTKLKEELVANFEVLLTSYPSGQNVNNLLAANVFGVDKDFILVGNGAAELIKALMETLSGSTVVITPTFEEYPNRLPNHKIRYYTSNSEGFTYSIDDLKEWIIENDQMILINPDNPSGNYISVSDIIEFTQFCYENEKLLILDESFIDFSKEGTSATMIKNQVLRRFSNLVVIKSISKSYGVPGLRLGVIASGNKKILKAVRDRLSIWNINSFGEFFMQIIDKYRKDYDKGCVLFRQERQRFYRRLKEVECIKVYPSEANYFLCKVISPHSSGEIAQKLLLENSILIKDCKNKRGFDDKDYIRLAIRSQSDNDLLIEALKLL